MSGFGLDAWGLGLFGGSGATPMALQSAVATGDRTVLVGFTVAPLQNSSIGLGDALNPASWVLLRMDTLVSFSVMSVRKVSDVLFELMTLEKFGDALITHRIDASAITDPSGVPIANPKTEDWPGCTAFKAALVPTGDVDIASIQLSDTALAGVLRVSPSSGDYETESGVKLLQKLIIRRLTTSPGSFYHLPGYGLGIQTKEPLLTSDLVSLKGEIERQVAREPEFAAVQAILTFKDNGELSLNIKAKLLKNNQQVTVPIPVKATGIQF